MAKVPLITNQAVLSTTMPVVICGAASGSKAGGTHKIWGRSSSEVFRDTTSSWNINGTFTAPFTGYYYMRISVRLSSNPNTGYDYLEVVPPNAAINGRPIFLWGNSGDTRQYRPYALECVLFLNKNDTISPQLTLAGTTTVDGGDTAQTDTQLHIYLIG